MTTELHRRLGTEGVTALAVHPGTCATDLARYMDRATLKKLFAVSAETFSPENIKTVAQAAEPHLGRHRTVPGRTWRGLSRRLPDRRGRRGGYRPPAARRLWELSQQWVELAPDELRDRGPVNR